MNISEPFIRRPVATILIAAGIALAGIIAFIKLPVAPVPQVDQPTISVNASMAGASPETMASSVATPLERRLGQIADVTEMTSMSSVGSSNITLQFELSRNIDGAARDVQAAINASRSDLPAALRSNPTYRKFNSSDEPIMVMELNSPTLSPGQLYDVASTILAQKISQLPGVGNVNVGGSSLPAVRVELNPQALFKYGIGLEDVRAALAAANANSPKGAIEDSSRHWQIYSNDQARTAADYRSLIVAYRNKAAVRLSDVANVLDSVEDIRNFAISNGHLAVVLIVSREPGANIIDTVDEIRALMPQLQADLPPSASLGIAIDRSLAIRASLKDVEISLTVSVILVVLVVFFFLRDWRATLIPAAAVPISLIGTFAAMYMLNYTLDNLSLMALTVATGFVVDDAIVVMENIVRHKENGIPRFKAALVGVRQVGFTVVSMSLSLIAVFIPVLLMGGVVGRLFREFTITLSASVLISLFISLTLTPMMCSRVLRRKGSEIIHGRLMRMSGRLLDDSRAMYEEALHWVLRHQPLVMAILAVTIGLNYVLFSSIPKGFFPDTDTGRLSGWIQADQSVSFQRMSEKVRRYTQIIQAEPEVTTVVGLAGSGRGTNSGQMFIGLKPQSERKASTFDLITRLRPKVNMVPGASLFLGAPSEIHIGGRQSNSTYQYTLQSDNLEDLRVWTPKLMEALKSEPVVTDLNTDQQDKGLETDLVVDRDMASRLGLTAVQVDNTLYDAFGQRQVSTIYESLNQYHVVMVVAPKYLEDPAILNQIYVSTAGGTVSGTQSTNAVAGTVFARSAASSTLASAATDVARNAALNSISAVGKSSASTGQAVSTSSERMIPLASFAHYHTGTTPLSVNHQGQAVAATISFNLTEDASLSDAVAAIDRQVTAIRMPSTIHGSFQGTARTYQESIGNEPVLILAAVIAIYVVLGILYESYAHPITILSTLPSAGLGAVLALLLFNTEFSLIALIGVILLIGIVKKNAIMMIDFAVDVERNEGLCPQDAIFKACLLRFRPIMMTTMAAILGAVPLAIGLGTGGELRRPLGISIVGGLIVSQALTLFTTPVVYLYVGRMRNWFLSLAHRFRRRAPALAAVNGKARVGA